MRLNINELIDKKESENLSRLNKAIDLSKSEHKKAKEAREFEDKKFEEFKEIIKDETYFDLDHIKQLNLNADITIHLSSKGAGKSVHIFKLFKDRIDRGEKVIYGRVLGTELATEARRFNEDERSPVCMVKGTDSWYFYKKSDVKEFKQSSKYGSRQFITHYYLSKAGYEYVGLGMSFLNSNTLGGGEYQGFTAIIFDEIVSYQPKDYVNDMVMSNWGCAVSTVLRNKSHLDIIMMGNLRQHLEYIPILDYYDIDISDDLRFLQRAVGDDDEPCKILFINSGSLYKGTWKNQASVAHHVPLEDRLFLEHNKPVNTSVKVLNRRIVEQMKYVFSFAFLRNDQTGIVFTLYESGEEPNKLALSATRLCLTTYVGGEIYASDEMLTSKFSILSRVLSIKPFVKAILSYLACGELYFDSIKSLAITTDCVKAWKQLCQR